MSQEVGHKEPSANNESLECLQLQQLVTWILAAACSSSSVLTQHDLDVKFRTCSRATQNGQNLSKWGFSKHGGPLLEAPMIRF